MYKNIIFDLGGVIVAFKPRDFLMDRFMNPETENLVYDLTFGSETWQELDRGNITRAVANEQMLAAAKEAGCQFEVQEVIETWVTILHRRQRVFDLAMRLKKAGYNIYYLSNMASDIFAYLQHKKMLPAFDGGIVSYEVHANKPEPEIYQALLDQYKLRPADCIFIDDTKANIDAAGAMGFTGIVLKSSVNTLTRNLRACGISLK